MSKLRKGKPADGSFRAEAGAQAVDVRLERGSVSVDGVPVDASFQAGADGAFSLLLDGRSYSGTVRKGPSGTHTVSIGGREVEVRVKDEQALLLERFGVGTSAGAAHREVHAPMPGLVLRVTVEAGQAVKAGEGLLVLEAMKMENELRAPGDGTVAALHVKPGDAVGKGDLLVTFED